MIISLVVAAADDHAIGAGNALLWKLPADMRFFKNLTWGMPIIMGRKTFASMASKPLPGRISIVVTRDASILDGVQGVLYAGSIDEALEKAKATDCMEVFVIGGGDIYRQVLPIADRIYMTRVHGTFPHADTFFPVWDSANFQLMDRMDTYADDKHAYACSFETWERVLPG